MKINDLMFYYFHIEDILITLICCYVRIWGVFTAMPLIKNGMFSKIIKSSFIFGLTLFIYPKAIEYEIEGYIIIMFLLLKEYFVGLIIGFIFSIQMYVFESFGFIIDNQRGSSSSSLVSSFSGDETSPIGDFYLMVSIFLFCTLGGLGYTIKAIYTSYDIWHLNEFLPSLFFDKFLTFICNMLYMFLYYFCLFSCPIIFSMMLTELSLGLVSRFAPQLNVFFLSMPIKSMTAIIVMFFMADYLVNIFHILQNKILNYYEMLALL